MNNDNTFENISHLLNENFPTIQNFDDDLLLKHVQEYIVEKKNKQETDIFSNGLDIKVTIKQANEWLFNTASNKSMCAEIMCQFISYLSIAQNFNNAMVLCKTSSIDNTIKRLLKDIKIPKFNQTNPFFLTNNPQSNFITIIIQFDQKWVPVILNLKDKKGQIFDFGLSENEKSEVLMNKIQKFVEYFNDKIKLVKWKNIEIKREKLTDCSISTLLFLYKYVTNPKKFTPDGYIDMNNIQFSKKEQNEFQKFLEWIFFSIKGDNQIPLLEILRLHGKKKQNKKILKLGIANIITNVIKEVDSEESSELSDSQESQDLLDDSLSDSQQEKLENKDFTEKSKDQKDTSENMNQTDQNAKNQAHNTSQNGDDTPQNTKIQDRNFNNNISKIQKADIDNLAFSQENKNNNEHSNDNGPTKKQRLKLDLDDDILSQKPKINYSIKEDLDKFLQSQLLSNKPPKNPRKLKKLNDNQSMRSSQTIEKQQQQNRQRNNSTQNYNQENDNSFYEFDGNQLSAFTQNSDKIIENQSPNNYKSIDIDQNISHKPYYNPEFQNLYSPQKYNPQFQYQNNEDKKLMQNIYRDFTKELQEIKYQQKRCNDNLKDLKNRQQSNMTDRPYGYIFQIQYYCLIKFKNEILSIYIITQRI